MSKETACAVTHYGNCVYLSDLPLMLQLQGRVGAYKIDVVGNTLLQISSGMLLPKIMKIGLRIKSYCKNKKGIVF